MMSPNPFNGTHDDVVEALEKAAEWGIAGAKSALDALRAEPLVEVGEQVALTTHRMKVDALKAQLAEKDQRTKELEAEVEQLRGLSENVAMLLRRNEFAQAKHFLTRHGYGHNPLRAPAEAQGEE